jgi:hypothetical protein
MMHATRHRVRAVLARASLPCARPRRDRGVRRSGCRETISTPAARTASTVASAGSTVTSQPTTEAGLGRRSGRSPSHASVRVSDDAELAYKPARHFSGSRRLQRRASSPNAHLVAVLRDLVEVPVDDVAGRPGQRRCPVAEELRHDGERRGRDCSGVRQPLDGCAVRGLRASADAGHIQETVSRRCFGECLEVPVGQDGVGGSSIGRITRGGPGRAARGIGPDVTAGTVMRW